MITDNWSWSFRFKGRGELSLIDPVVYASLFANQVEEATRGTRAATGDRPGRTEVFSAQTAGIAAVHNVQAG